MSRQRFVVHLPVVATDLPAALRFARAITRSLAFLADVDRRLDAGRRCSQPADHDGPCGPAKHR